VSISDREGLRGGGAIALGSQGSKTDVTGALRGARFWALCRRIGFVEEGYRSQRAKADPEAATFAERFPSERPGGKRPSPYGNLLSLASSGSKTAAGRWSR